MNDRLKEFNRACMMAKLEQLRAGELQDLEFMVNGQTLNAKQMEAHLEAELGLCVKQTTAMDSAPKPEKPCVAADFNQDSADQACKLISECQQRGLGLEVATAALKSGLSDMDAAIRSGQEALAMDAMDRAAEAIAAKLNGAPAL